MNGFDDKNIDIVNRLNECADIDEAEGATQSVVSMTREAAHTINILVLQRDELLAALKEIAAIENEMYGADWDEIDKARGIAKEAIDKADLHNEIS